MTLDAKAVTDEPIQTNLAGHDRSKARPLAAIKFEATLGQIVLVLMRSRQHRHSFLGDLEWLVLPAIATNQFMLAEHRDGATGISVPAAVVLWAQVSKEVDARLSASPDQRILLKPEEWASGAIPWLVEGVGEARAVGSLVHTLVEGRFLNLGIKTVGRSPDGTPSVRVLSKHTTAQSAAQHAQAAEAAAPT
jgi:hemolysin-activating ACP:hemolysin acyltransferase